MSRCFFIGHREAPETILSPLFSAVERHIVEYHVNEFVVGHYGSFDRFAQKAVTDAKKRFPDVTLTILLPYHPSVFWQQHARICLICAEARKTGFAEKGHTA